MTGIDLMAGMMLAACVEHTPMTVQAEPMVTITMYECPLIGHEAAFVVWRRVCSIHEQYAVAIRDERSWRGFYYDRFRQLQPAYVSAGVEIYLPRCATNTETLEAPEDSDTPSQTPRLESDTEWPRPAPY